MPGSPDWRVLCMNDECDIGPFCDFNTEAEAIAAWNRRLSPKPDPVSEGERAAVIEACAREADAVAENETNAET